MGGAEERLLYVLTIYGTRIQRQCTLRFTTTKHSLSYVYCVKEKEPIFVPGSEIKDGLVCINTMFL